MTTRVVLLPGMDGTGELFAGFVERCPEEFATHVIALPADRALGYDEWAEHVRARLPRESRCVLLGESFSGPLALRLAAQGLPGLCGVVMCASFVRAPVAGCWLRLAAHVAARVPPPRRLIRRLLAGGDLELADDVRRALSRVTPDVVAARLRLLAAVDASVDLRGCPVPVLALVATQDRVVGPSATATINALRPDVTVVPIDAPHLLLQTAPDAAWDAITEWFRSPDRGAGTVGRSKVE